MSSFNPGGNQAIRACHRQNYSGSRIYYKHLKYVVLAPTILHLQS